MYVEDVLTRVLPCIEDYSVAAVLNALFGCDISGLGEYMADHMLLILWEFVERGKVVFRDKKDMNRRLRVNVLKSENMFVFVDNPGGNFFVYDFTKYAGVHI